EEKLSSFFIRESGEFTERMHDGPFVGGDRMGAELQCSFDMVDGGFAGGRVEGTGFEDYVGAGTLDPFAHVAGSSKRLLRGPVAVENGERIQAVGIDEPADAARRDPGETPTHVIATPQL